MSMSATERNRSKTSNQERMQRGTTRGIWRPWTIATALGELLGFAVPAAVGAGAAALGVPEQTMTAPLIVAGAGEGAVLGLAQWLVLRQVLPAIRWWEWAGLTALGALVAWCLGMIPSSINLAAVSPWLLGAGVTLAAPIFLLTIGGAQWLVLRRVVRYAGWWVLANAVAWPLGVAVPMIALTAIPDSTPMWLRALVGIASGLGMGLVVGAITGAALAWLLKRNAARPYESYGPG